MKIERGTIVTLEYDVTTSDGQIVESSQLSSAVTIMQGYGSLLPGLEQHLEGMEAGEEKQVELAPEEAFGRSEDAPVQKISRSEFPAGTEFEVGMGFEANAPDGQLLQLEVMEVDEAWVMTRIKHPLADQSISVEFKVLETRAPTEKELEQQRPILAPPPAPKSAVA